MAAPAVHHSYSHYHGLYVYDHGSPYSQYQDPVFATTIRSRKPNGRTPVKPELQRSWSGVREQEGYQREDYMSERSTNQPRPESSTDRERNNQAQPALSSSSSSNLPGQYVTTNTSTAASPSIQRQPVVTGRGFELPPLPQAPSVTGVAFSPSTVRLAGVPSILNPSYGTDGQQGRRRKASELDSPRSSTTVLPPLMTATHHPASAGPYSGLSAFSPVTMHSASGDRPGRRILTPRSPSLHRAASLNQLNPATGTISAQQSPFPISPRTRPYMIEPGTGGAPPLPTPPAGMRPGYGFPAPAQTMQSQRRASGGANRARAPSSSASPTTSYSSYSQAGQTSPVTQYASASMPTLSAPYATVSDGTATAPGTASAPPGQDRQRAIGIPISSSASQNVYQMMTLETTSGTVQLPVDVQAASRVADEKRRRNAGASARFRQRRKEKEREASTTIAKLEQQVKHLGEDAAFYKNERDFFSNVVRAQPGGERYFPRHPSPRHRRSSSVLAGPSGTSTSGYGSAQEQAPPSPEEERSVRRRTSTFSLPPPPPPLQTAGAPMHPGYAPQPYGTPLASQPPSALQGAPSTLPSPVGRIALPGSAALFSSIPAYQQYPQQQQQQQPSSSLPPGPPQLMQAAPQTGPWNPYASERRPPGPPYQPHDGR